MQGCRGVCGLGPRMLIAGCIGSRGAAVVEIHIEFESSADPSGGWDVMKFLTQTQSAIPSSEQETVSLSCIFNSTALCRFLRILEVGPTRETTTSRSMSMSAAGQGPATGSPHAGNLETLPGWSVRLGWEGGVSRVDQSGVFYGSVHCCAMSWELDGQHGVMRRRSLVVILYSLCEGVFAHMTILRCL